MLKYWIGKYGIIGILAVLGVFLYSTFAYNLERNEFLKLLFLYSALILITYWLIEKRLFNFWPLVGLGIAFRLIFLFALPNLSQDFYRFIWDGRLLAQGISPYLYTPDMIISGRTPLEINISQAEELYQGMGSLSASNFSSYPPINQFFYSLATLFANKSILGSVIVLRILIVFADIGILYFGRKLLILLSLPVNRIFWCFLNPFIIIELTGNLHFEGVMLFFFIVGLYLFLKNKWIASAIMIAISISVKLIPLLLLPLFFELYKKHDKTHKMNSLLKLFIFYGVILGIVVITFLPFISMELLQNFSASISLWFQKFEFNASVYYVLRWLGYKFVGWNIIATLGKILPLLVILFIGILSLTNKKHSPQSMITKMLWAVSFYFLLSTTIHPWYIATPLLLCLFTNYRFPIVWSFIIFLSYSAYGNDGFDENLWLVTLEYVIIIGVAIFEITMQSADLEAIKNRSGLT